MKRDLETHQQLEVHTVSEQHEKPFAAIAILHLLVTQLQLAHAVFAPNLQLTLMEEPQHADRIQDRQAAELQLENYFQEVTQILVELERIQAEISTAHYWQLVTRYGERTNQFFTPLDNDVYWYLFKDKISELYPPLREFEKQYRKYFMAYILQHQPYRAKDKSWPEIELVEPIKFKIRELQIAVSERIALEEATFVQHMVAELMAEEPFFDQVVDTIRQNQTVHTLADITTVSKLDAWDLKGTAFGWLQLCRELIDKRIRASILQSRKARANKKPDRTTSKATNFLIEIDQAASTDERNDYFNEPSENILLSHGLSQVYLHLAYCVMHEYIKQNRKEILRELIAGTQQLETGELELDDEQL